MQLLYPTALPEFEFNEKPSGYKSLDLKGF
jgi:hypothetical protein